MPFSRQGVKGQLFYSRRMIKPKYPKNAARQALNALGLDYWLPSHTVAAFTAKKRRLDDSAALEEAGRTDGNNRDPSTCSG